MATQKSLSEADSLQSKTIRHISGTSPGPAGFFTESNGQAGKGDSQGRKKGQPRFPSEILAVPFPAPRLDARRGGVRWFGRDRVNATARDFDGRGTWESQPSLTK